MKKVLMSVLALLLTGGLVFANSTDGAAQLPKGLQGIKIGGLYYLHYQTGKSGGEDYNRFRVSRAYLTVKKELMPGLAARITLDTHQDDTGDMKVRVKYAYAHFTYSDFGFITKPNLEFGLVHTPWLDFEEHLNYYRMQGHMFMEEEGLFNSADFGATFGGLFGEKLDKSYLKQVNSKYPGRYGSFAVGVYNGGGYHAPEKNTNKTVEGRLSIRPVPAVLPGLQLSLFSVYGKGNVAEVEGKLPDWNLNTVMLSLESRTFTLAGQVISGKGNQKGSMVEMQTILTDDGNGGTVETVIPTTTSLQYSGTSLFVEGKFGDHWRAIGRLDRFDGDVNTDNNEHTRFIIGGAYDMGHHNILLLDYQVVQYDADQVDDDTRLQLTMQIHF